MVRLKFYHLDLFTIYFIRFFSSFSLPNYCIQIFMNNYSNQILFIGQIKILYLNYRLVQYFIKLNHFMDYHFLIISSLIKN
jgi:hypothetical protein